MQIYPGWLLLQQEAFSLLTTGKVYCSLSAGKERETEELVELEFRES